MESTERTYTAFAGDTLVASGQLRTLLPAAWQRQHAGTSELLLVFEDWTGRQVDFDLRGTVEEVVARAEAAHASEEAQAGARRGRPRLGVVSRNSRTASRRRCAGWSTRPASASLRRSGRGGRSRPRTAS
jgi:hypothetical protein